MTNWGGKRVGSGRPKGSGKYSVATKPMRVPETLVSEISRWIKEGNKFALPLYDSPVKAGFPSPADDYVGSQLNLNDHLIKNPETTFFLRVAGESMLGAGISPGDLLVVDRSLNATHGKIVIAAINNELTVKRFCKEKNRCFLKPENPEFPSIVLTNTDDIHIWGVVIHVIKTM